MSQFLQSRCTSIRDDASRKCAAPIQSAVWEERWHPLREEWVIVAAHRQSRPWSGETLPGLSDKKPSYDPACYLCPGNARPSGERNPLYSGSWIFPNDYPCVGSEAPRELETPPEPYRNRRADGQAYVLCYNPLHDLTLAQMSEEGIVEVIRVWQQQTFDLGKRPEVRHVLCFENKGKVVGVSNPHPHGQIYATNFVFKTIETELIASRRHLAETGRMLMSDIIAAEHHDGRRVLYEDEHTIAFLPYFARYAYETYVVPKRCVAHVYGLDDVEVLSLARALKDVTVRFDNLWRMPFPYVMPLHQAPADEDDYRAFGFFVAFHPPLRFPNMIKYLGGPETGGGNFLSDTAPEEKAAELRAVPSTHYTEDIGVGEQGNQ